MSDGNGGRRRALVLFGTGAGALALAVASPVALGLRPTGQAAHGKERWLRAAKLDDLREGAPKRVGLTADERDAWVVEKDVLLGVVWLVREGDKVRALSATCPHLGCAVGARSAGGFSCPCHDSDFAADGKCLGGPSPRDLDPLATRVVDGWVEVDFRRFRVGSKERVEVG
jgi:cytochrome b6-f complex iron-sulfur subunit/menaquinol-cytochrome c reductase iron-sulfur subunit